MIKNAKPGLIETDYQVICLISRHKKTGRKYSYPVFKIQKEVQKTISL